MTDQPDLPEDEQDAISRWLEAEISHQADRRRTVVLIATRIVEVLSGEADYVKREPSDPSREMAGAPDAIPALGWTDSLRVKANEAEEREQWDLSSVGNLGEYYSSRFTDERPSDTFNIAFYAGVLAVKKGLVDPADFHDESEEDVR